MKRLYGFTGRSIKFLATVMLGLLVPLAFAGVTKADTFYIRESSGLTITGFAGQTNLPINNASDLGASNGSYLTILGNSAPSGSNTTIMRESYTAAGTRTLGRAVFNTSYAGDVTIPAGDAITGYFWLRASRSDDRFRFQIVDYDPADTSSPTIIASHTGNIPPSGNIDTGDPPTLYTVNFTPLASDYTLPAGHYIGLIITYINSSGSTRRGYVYCTSSYPSRFVMPITHKMTAIADAHGTITSTGINAQNSTVVSYDSRGSSRTYSISADSGYTIQNVKVDGVDQGAITTYTFTNITAPHSIEVVTTATLNNVTINQDTGGHVVQGLDDCTSSSCSYTRYSGTYTFVFAPDANYSLYGLSINGVVQPVPGGQVTTYSLPIAIAGSTTIDVDWEPLINVTSSAGTGGTISPSGTTAVPRGQSLTLDIVPDAGYRIFSITDNGVNVGNTSPYTLTNIQATHDVVVTFMPVHTLTATAGPNGTITPVGDTIVDHGSTLLFTMNGNTGYVVSDVVVDGVSVGAVTNYTFTGITADHTIAVTFAAASIPSDYCAIPPFIASSAPPNVMLMLSVETPMQGPANVKVTPSGIPSDINYTASSTSGGCGNGALGCYDNAMEYYGYFESGKCYTYSSDMFVPSGAATNHQCAAGTAWSGNFLNWATTMAVDAFRKAFTGGNRDTDTTSSTVILAARHQSSWFPDPVRIDNAELYVPVSGSGVTRYLRRAGTGMGFVLCNAGQTNCSFSTTGSGESRFPVAGSNAQAAYKLRIKACDSTGGVETRCNTVTNKPEGVIQKYMDRIRFALISYAADNSESRDGGVLRANMKWVGPKIPYGLRYHDAGGSIQTCNSSAGCANPVKEVDDNGLFQNNPDGASSANSGVINYINKFAYASGYKSHDPMGEMYYEVVRYFMNLTPSVNNYCNGLTSFSSGYADGFAFYCNSSKTNTWGWRNPTLYSCSKNFVIAINDANPWLDKRIPGSAFKADYGGTSSWGDWCGSSYGACDTDFTLGGTAVNVEEWTNKVGDIEGLTGKTFGSSSRMFGCEVDGSGVCIGGFNSGGKSITLGKLGRIVGTPPYPAKENSYNVAGLAYFAHVNNLRPDLNHCSVTTSTTCTTNTDCPTGETCIINFSNLTTYMIDTQEPASNMLVGPMNMLYLAAKYGGFEDKNNDQSVTISGRTYNTPYTSRSTTGPAYSLLANSYNSEWTTGINGTGNPDTYYFASEASKVESSLNKAFSSILNKAASGTAAAVANNKSGERGANIIQALFYPEWPNDKNVKWLGEVQALWYYLDPIISYSGIYEDTNGDRILDLNLDLMPGSDPFLTKALWKAGVELHKRSESTRNIYTLLSTSQMDLTNSTNAFVTGKASTLKSLLDVGSYTDAQTDALVTYLRGTDGGSYRSRTLTNGATTSCWKLGDVINSTPQVQSAIPTNSYHQTYSDGTYSTYIGSDQYKSNNVVYAGSNDGMMHAFKLGLVQKVTDATKPFRISQITDTSDLGKEYWAFIPTSALPYMKNQADQNYCHQYLLDGSPLVFDASINKHTSCSGNYWECERKTTLVGGAGTDKNQFVPTTTSWRTVLIGSMGLGGASRSGNCNETLAHDSDLSNNTDCVKTPVSNFGYSSYFALDVTNPLTPKYMWEFSDAVLPSADKGLGLTTPGSAIVRINAQVDGSPDKSKNGRWFAVIASGPTGRINTSTRQFLGRSDQNLKIYVVDINAANTDMVNSPTYPTFVKNTNYWVFEPTGSDGQPIKYAFSNSISGSAVELDRAASTLPGYYSDDVVYITYTKATLDSDGYPVDWNRGGVMRLVTNNDPNPANWFFSPLVDSPASQSVTAGVVGPITTSIAKLQDRNNKKLWVYFGEGRYFYQGDNLNETRRIFGVADPCYNYDIEHINTLSTVASNCPAVTVNSTNFKDMTNTPTSTLSTEKGWYITLDAATGTRGAERLVSDVTAAANGIVFFTTYVPNSDLCLAAGTTSLWAVLYNSGGTPPSGGLKGKAPLQTSSGGITMIDLATAFTDRGGRKLASGLSPSGMAPKGRFPPLLQPKPVKKIISIQER